MGAIELYTKKSGRVYILKFNVLVKNNRGGEHSLFPNTFQDFFKSLHIRPFMMNKHSPSSWPVLKRNAKAKNREIVTCLVISQSKMERSKKQTGVSREYKLGGEWYLVCI